MYPGLDEVVVDVVYVDEVLEEKGLCVLLLELSDEEVVVVVIEVVDGVEVLVVVLAVLLVVSEELVPLPAAAPPPLCGTGSTDLAARKLPRPSIGSGI